MSRHCVCIVGSSSQLQVKHVDELTRATWQHSKLSPPLKPLLSNSPLCLLSLSLFSAAWALWKSSSGNASENPTFLAQSCGACSKLFQLTNLRRLEISRDPKTSSLCHTGSFRLIWKGNWFLRPTQSLDCPLSKRLREGLFWQICVCKRESKGNSLSVNHCSCSLTITNETNQ